MVSSEAASVLLFPVLACLNPSHCMRQKTLTGVPPGMSAQQLLEALPPSPPLSLIKTPKEVGGPGFSPKDRRAPGSRVLAAPLSPHPGAMLSSQGKPERRTLGDAQVKALVLRRDGPERVDGTKLHPDFLKAPSAETRCALGGCQVAPRGVRA